MEQEYEVLEESEEEDDGVSVGDSISRLNAADKSLKVINKGQPAVPAEEMSSRRRVMIEGDDMGDESFYIEEIIEESEEESDEVVTGMDNNTVVNY